MTAPALTLKSCPVMLPAARANQNGWESLKQQLDDKAHPIRIDLPGHKKARNVRAYHTYVGGDAIEALRNYVDNHRPKDAKVIFPNRFGRAISKNALYLYWLRHLRKLGLVSLPVNGVKNHRTGKNPHELRDVFRSQWEKSPTSGTAAEFFMGHNIDPLEYNKAYRDETWTSKST
jgi:integrase